MYRPPIGPVSAIERAIVCMRMPGLADLRQPISRGEAHREFQAPVAHNEASAEPTAPKTKPATAKPKHPAVEAAETHPHLMAEERRCCTISGRVCLSAV